MSRALVACLGLSLRASDSRCASWPLAACLGLLLRASDSRCVPRPLAECLGLSLRASDSRSVSPLLVSAPCLRAVSPRRVSASCLRDVSSRCTACCRCSVSRSPRVVELAVLDAVVAAALELILLIELPCSILEACGSSR